MKNVFSVFAAKPGGQDPEYYGSNPLEFFPLYQWSLTILTSTSVQPL